MNSVFTNLFNGNTDYLYRYMNKNIMHVFCNINLKFYNQPKNHHFLNNTIPL